MMMVATNGGSVPVEPGDVAEIRGIAPSGVPARQSILRVGSSLEADSTAVAGVVRSRFSEVLLTAPPQGIPEETRAKLDAGGPIRGGEYMLLVMYGPAQLTTSAIGGGIAPGDLLTTSDLVATARRVSDRSGSRATGAVLGRALEPVAEGRNTSDVFVTLRSPPRRWPLGARIFSCCTGGRDVTAPASGVTGRRSTSTRRRASRRASGRRGANDTLERWV